MDVHPVSAERHCAHLSTYPPEPSDRPAADGPASPQPGRPSPLTHASGSAATAAPRVATRSRFTPTGTRRDPLPRIAIAKLLTESELAENWQLWRERHEISARNALIRHFWPIVEKIAHGIAGKVGPSLWGEELYTDGLVGLLIALRNFNPRMEVSFETFAWAHVRGRMQDALRSMDFFGRGVRARAGRLGEDVPSVVTLSVMLADDAGDPTGSEPAALTDRQPTAFERVEAADFWAFLCDRTKADIGRVLDARFKRCLTLDETAAELGVARHRVEYLQKIGVAIVAERHQRHEAGERGAA